MDREPYNSKKVSPFYASGGSLPTHNKDTNHALCGTKC